MGGEFTSKQFTWIAEELRFIKVYTSHTSTGNYLIKHTHSFIKASLYKLVCNHKTDWDELAHVAMMAYNDFLHSLAGKAPFYLMFGHDTFMPTLFKLTLSKLRHIGHQECKIQLDAMREIYL